VNMAMHENVLHHGQKVPEGEVSRQESPLEIAY
jgi:hypothetical protein